MASELFALDVVIDAGFVGQEVFVDVEGGLDGTVGHDLGLDLLDFSAEGVDLFCEVEVFFVVGGVSGYAAFLTFRSWFLCSTGFVSSGCVVVTRWERIGFAPVGCVK